MHPRKYYHVIVTGTASYDDFPALVERLDHLLKHKLPNVVIVSGSHVDVDFMGEEYARMRGLRCHIFPPDFEQFRDKAPFHRNAQMANFANALVVFHSGTSRALSHLIRLAYEKGMPARTIEEAR